MTLYYQFFRFLILPGKFQDRIARLDKFRDKSEQPAPFFFSKIRQKTGLTTIRVRVSQNGRLLGQRVLSNPLSRWLGIVYFLSLFNFLRFGIWSVNNNSPGH